MDFSSWIAPGAVGTLFLSALFVALFTRLESINRPYRLRRNLKDEVDLASKLPEGARKDELLAIIASDLEVYNRLRNPSRRGIRSSLITIIMSAVIGVMFVAGAYLALYLHYGQLPLPPDQSSEDAAFNLTVALTSGFGAASSFLPGYYAYKNLKRQRSIAKGATPDEEK